MRHSHRFKCRLSGTTRLRHLLLAVLLAALVMNAGAIAQETPRFLMSDVLSVLGRCGEDRILVRARDQRGVRIDLNSRKQVSTPPIEVGWSREVAMGEDVQCSSDGRWAFNRYGPYNFSTHACGEPSTVALWDTAEGRSYVIGRGDWDIRWAPDRSMAVYRFQGGCQRERDRGVRFALPAQVKGLRVVALREIVRRALGPNPGWNVDNPIDHFTWLAPDRILVQLGELNFERRAGQTNGVILVVAMRDGVGIAAVEQLNPEPFRSSMRLAIPQTSADRSHDILRAAGCFIIDLHGQYGQVLHCETPRRWDYHDSVQVDLERYCASLTAGDVEQFCRGVPRGPGWRRWIIDGRVLLLKGGSWIPDPRCPMKCRICSSWRTMSAAM